MEMPIPAPSQAPRHAIHRNRRVFAGLRDRLREIGVALLLRDHVDQAAEAQAPSTLPERLLNMHGTFREQAEALPERSQGKSEGERLVRALAEQLKGFDL